jgi:hypothetical protein
MANKDAALRREAVENFLVLLDKPKLPEVLAQVFINSYKQQLFVCIYVLSVICALFSFIPFQQMIGVYP